MNLVSIDLIKNNGYQEVNIPQNFNIDDDKVYIKKVGNVIYLIPFHNPWMNLIDSITSFTPDYMENREQPDFQLREEFE
jgi:antitoxin VapB